MASASSSSGSMPNALRKYDVFISFRGEDTRNNFTSHLHAALNRASLEVFRDDKKLKKGDEIAPSPTQAIKDSSVSVIVFSEDYASSKWCLDELHQIMQFRKEEGQFVIPIFYKVDPKDVRNQTGAYKEAFEKYEKNYQHDPERVIRWRAALSEAGQLSCWGCQTSMDESNLIEEIVAVVCTKLERIHNCHGTLKDVIGIDEMVKPIEELLKKSHKVGIWGMGGVGKTTMAKVVFAKLSSQYSHRCFLENVREQTKKKGLKHVRDSLVSKLLGEDKQIDLSDRESVFRRLSRTKAFVVLDDVDTTEQFKNLHDYTCNSLGEGSKVIITTRDRGLLPLKGCEIHEAKGLSYENSRRLFIRKAFGSDNAEDGYEELIKGFVDYAEHNPLALEVLGLYVHSEDKKFWGDLLKDLRAGNPHDDIQKVLKLSYDRLDYIEKQIFLDIACFLKGESEEFVKELMESYGFDPTIGMQTLKDKALIDTTNEKVEMHNLIQEMGRQIVFQESIKEPGKRSRLWDSSEISSVLGNCEGGEKVEGIILLDRYATGVSYLTAKTFNKMTRLRFLKIHSPWDYDMSTTAGGLESISTQIRYFHWECYPMKSLPSNFCAKHLLELNLAYGKVETLWEGLQDMANLRRLTLKWCLNLRELPDFSQACRLETVDLSCCKSLCYVHASLLSLHSLISLDVRRCISLKGLQSRIPLKSLKEISMDECIVLKEFSVSSKELTSLNLSFTKIEKLGPSIGLCSNLTTLHLGRCLNLTELSDSITQLSSLEKLYLPECPKLTKLPDNMRLLSKLQYLSVRRCTALRSLPELPPSLRTLSATDCTSLETVSLSTISSTPQNKGEKYFSFNNCVKLDLGAIEEQVKLLLAKAAHEKEHVKVYYPGKTVPEWFGNNRKQNDSDPLKLCLSSNTLVGFVFGAVAPDVLNGSIGHLDIVFSVEEDEMTEEVVRSGDFTYGNVLLCSNPKSSESILEKIKGKRRNHDATTYNPNLSFKLCFNGFGFDQFGGHSSNEEFGVYPIYASGRERETPMASASSSSDSVPKVLRKYDVFISFGGEDTRNNFTSQLHVALNRASLEVFRDDEKLQKGHETAQAIKDSSVSVIVFSEDYASSKWCLDELHHIMQYRTDEGQFVIPIFYKVEPSDVRNQTGAYKKAFENHEIDYQHDPDRVNRWRAALSKAGKLSGWDCKSSMDESTLIQKIVTDVSTKLELKDVIGIDEMIEPIEELLEKSHKVGIWGMGGVGKTTMAKALFAKLSYRYDNCCFLENVREKTEKNGSAHVRNSLISKLLGQDMQNDPLNASRNNAYVARRLSTKKVLVVLDDVDSFKLLKYLQENICNFLAKGSKVIITTRDEQLLQENDYKACKATGLSYQNSLQLFVSKAFQSDHLEDGYEQLIKGFVHYTQHNPLALKVLGSLVRSVHKKEWDDLLRKLRAGSPNDVIQKVLKLSYKGLDHEEQQIFLNIACFLKGESKEFVEELLKSYGFHPTINLQTLKAKALIVTTVGKVDMHDLIQEMGHRIVHEESIKESGKRSRLWDTSEIFDVFKNCKGGEKVEGIILLDRYATGVSYLTAKTFNKMTRLRFLKIHSPWDYDMSTTSEGLESISTQIRYFHWECYPMKSLPSNFCAKHLLELNLNRSWVETLWEGEQDLANLRRLKLQWCRNLRELPDFFKACRLESVDLRGCESLCYVHASLLSLDSLISLDVGHCWSLESLQSRIHLKSLKEINIDGCYNVEEFSVSSEELTSLDLSGTMIEELSPSIGLCSKLTTLYLPDKKLKNLPIKVLSCLTFLKELHISLLEIDNVDDLRVLFDRLRSLQSLSLRKCRNLIELPDNITQLSCLEKLHLAKCPYLTKLPVNMRLLSKLQHLSVKGYTALISLPELPPSLRKLYATNCTSLETVSPSTISSTTQNKGEKVFSFKNCLKLDLGAIEEQGKLLLEKAVHENEDVEVYYPGKKVPEWLGNNRSQNDSDTLKLCLSSHTLAGFVICAVAPDFLEEELCGYLHIAFSVDEDKMTEEVVEFPELTYFTDGNVLLRSYPKASESIREKIEGKRRNHDATTYNPNLFFKFSFTSGFLSKPIKECGVYPIYTS